MYLFLVLLEGSYKGHRVKLELGDAVIGRARGNSVRLPSEKVSRRHCRLWLERRKVWVEDLGSENGTFVNDDRVVRKVELKSGDELKLAHIRFQVRFQPERADKREDKTEPLPGPEISGPGLVPLDEPMPEGEEFDLPLDEGAERPGRAADSMDLPAHDPFDFKNILRELDDDSSEDE